MNHLLVSRWCTGCADERLFEVPPCVDGHGADCPDLACVDCGAAVSVGIPLVVAVPVGPAAVAA